MAENRRKSPKNWQFVSNYSCLLIYKKIAEKSPKIAENRRKSPKIAENRQKLPKIAEKMAVCLKLQLFIDF
jgi:hypothetical protein